MSILIEASHGLHGDKFKSDHQVNKGLKTTCEKLLLIGVQRKLILRK